MASKKEKFKEALKKGFTEAKKGYKEASMAVKKYGPGVHAGLGKVASSIQEGMASSPRMIQRNGRMVMHKPRSSRKKMLYVNIPKKGKARMVKIKQRPSKVDWAGLGVRY